MDICVAERSDEAVTFWIGEGEKGKYAYGRRSECVSKRVAEGLRWVRWNGIELDGAIVTGREKKWGRLHGKGDQKVRSKR